MHLKVIVYFCLHFAEVLRVAKVIVVPQRIIYRYMYQLLVRLSAAGVILYGGPRASSLLNLPEAHSFHHEYSSMACTVEIVDDVQAAIDHIHQHGRHVMSLIVLIRFIFIALFQ